MRRTVLLAVLITTIVAASTDTRYPSSQHADEARARQNANRSLLRRLASTPISFEKHVVQTPNSVSFRARAQDYTLTLTSAAAVFALDAAHPAQVALAPARAKAQVVPVGQLE